MCVCVMEGEGSSSSSVDLHHLLAVCASLALQAGEVIRSVHAERVAGGQGVLEGFEKDQGDVKSVATVADISAQRVITTALRRAFPGLTIVGEEEDDGTVAGGTAEARAETGGETAEHPFSASQCLAAVPPGAVALPLCKVCVYIDPLDGTHEFVQARLAHVQTLIGVSVAGTPLAGVMGLPFWGQREVEVEVEVHGHARRTKHLELIEGGSGGAVIAGAVGYGTFGYQRAVRCPEEQGQTLRVAGSSSGTTVTPVLAAAARVLARLGGEPSVVPACGNKVLHLLTGHSDVTLFNLKSSLWDSCATQAVLTAAGGQLTDLCGCAINHCHPDEARGGVTGNVYGVLATASNCPISHEAIAAAFRAEPDVNDHLFGAAGLRTENGQASASDVCRDTYGLPITVSALNQCVHGSGGDIVAYHCPEAEAQRYIMSQACRLHLQYATSISGSTSGSTSGGDVDGGVTRPTSVFLKRAVMRDLPSAAAKAISAPHKLARDVRSYLVEASFLSSQAVVALSGSPHGARVPACYKAELHPEEHSPLDSRFSLLLEDFSPALGWGQCGQLHTARLRGGALALARFHAFFWNGGICNRLLSASAVQELQERVWPVATHWAPSRQAASLPSEVEALWSKRGYGGVAAEGGFGDGSAAHVALGGRLQAAAAAAATACHFDGDSGQARAQAHPHRTVLHGDAKASNFFFRSSGSDSGSGSGSGAEEVGLIDFQWCGFGLPGTELAYYVASCAEMSALDENGDKERELLRQYHEALCASLAALAHEEGGGLPRALPPTPTQLLQQYELGLVDICKTAFAYHWQRLPATPALFTAERKASLAPCGYNKDVDVARWLVRRCDGLLRKLEEKERE